MGGIMKTIKVIAIEKRATEAYVENLRPFFENYAEVQGICLRDQSIPGKVDADVIVVSNPAIFNYISDLVNKDSQIVYIDNAFYQKDIEKLTDIPNGTSVLLVDYKEYLAITTTALLNEYGINHINIVPYGPEMNIKNIEEFNIAVTPALFEYVPKEIKEIINIGYRKIDISTIARIASILEISNLSFNKKLIEYSDELCNKSKVLASILKNLNKDQIHIDAILDIIDDGIIIHDNNHKILHCSKYLCKFFKKEIDLFSECPNEIMKLCEELILIDETENRLMKLGDDNITLVVTKKKLNLYNNNENNYIIILKDAESIHNIEIDIRKSLANKGYVAKYSFEDMVYHGPAMKKTIAIAKKIATLNVTTLLYGDTGTGKELMAHAIHNNSIRSHSPFLAINCAAISESLLDSELFGYEEGAFTGAKKGGKKGLFELAHNGTLFLDEISCISTQMQVKLLRVLQEREIMRIGGSTLIPINVRIIASTNENLQELIEKGKFRKDLYYRINNFTVTIPPLKERKEDIPFIIKSIMESHKSKKTIDGELMNFLIKYEWPGNIRELKNCIEYLIYMSGNTISMLDLPSTLITDKSPYNNSHNALFHEEKELVDKIIDICSYRSIGRESLHSLLDEQGFHISEYKLRKMLDYLNEKNIITIGRGRSGIKVVS
jgi:transcriptional regulator with PAS, ATPase and Fis domain